MTLSPPAERDLPPGRAARMRADLLTAARRPRRDRTRLRVAVAATAAVAVAVTTGFALRPDDRSQVLAMVPGEMSPTLRDATRQCLEWNSRTRMPGESPRVDVTMSDIAVAAQQGDRSLVLFLTRAGYVACDVTVKRGAETSGSISGEPWPHRDWVPGPVQRLSLSSSEPYGGDVTVIGRVSGRVHRLVLEHGTGHTTTARLSRGAFGILTEEADVTKSAELVAYDAGGREIGRQRLFTPLFRTDHCYTDPSGTVLYGEPGRPCLPAEPWIR